MIAHRNHLVSKVAEDHGDKIAHTRSDVLGEPGQTGRDPKTRERIEGEKAVAERVTHPALPARPSKRPRAEVGRIEGEKGEQSGQGRGRVPFHGKELSEGERVASPLATLPSWEAEDRGNDLAIFRHLRELSVRASAISRDFYRHVMGWSLSQLLGRNGGKVEEDGGEQGGGEGMRRRWDQVPVRFRDARHYLDVFEPLLIEECRCALAKEAEEGLREGSWRGRSGGRRNGAGEVSLRLVMAQKQVEAGEEGMWTAEFEREDGQVGGEGGAEVWVLWVKGVEERAGEEGVGGARHTLAVLMVEGEEVKEAKAGEGKLKFRVWIDPAGNSGPGSDPAPGARPESDLARGLGPGGLGVRDLEGRGERWLGMSIGSAVTSLREFGALREVCGVQLLGRLLCGGEGGDVGRGSGWVQTDAEGLRRMLGEVGEWVGRGMAGRGEEGEESREGRRRVRRLGRVRVSRRLLAETGAGRMLTAWKKECGDDGVRRICKQVGEEGKGSVCRCRCRCVMCISA